MSEYLFLTYIIPEIIMAGAGSNAIECESVCVGYTLSQSPGLTLSMVTSRDGPSSTVLYTALSGLEAVDTLMGTSQD